MGCNCGGGKPQPMFSRNKEETVVEHDQKILSNLKKASQEAPNLFKWFKDGVTGIVKCITGQQEYSDQQIKSNRDICRECEHSTKDVNGKLTLKSQCMAPDPAKGGAACGCFIVCKSQTGKCPLGKWVTLTVSSDNTVNDKDVYI